MADYYPGLGPPIYPPERWWIGDLLRPRVYVRSDSSEALKAVAEQILMTTRWRVRDICKRNPNIDIKQIYNAVGYLTRKRKIKRVAYGVYENV